MGRKYVTHFDAAIEKLNCAKSVIFGYKIKILSCATIGCKLFQQENMEMRTFVAEISSMVETHLTSTTLKHRSKKVKRLLIYLFMILSVFDFGVSVFCSNANFFLYTFPKTFCGFFFKVSNALICSL